MRGGRDRRDSSFGCRRCARYQRSSGRLRLRSWAGQLPGNNGFHVVVEGILHVDRYGTMLQDLVRTHRGVSRCYYLHVPYAETVLRHATKPDAEYLKQVTANHLRDWYREKDLLPGDLETVIDAASSLNETVQQILCESGLDQVLPIDR